LEEITFIQSWKTAEERFDRGETVYWEGADSPKLYTVLKGWGFRFKALPDDRRQILNFVLPGDFLGLQGSVFGELQHSVQALTPMVLCVFPKDRLWDLYAHHSNLAFDLTWIASRSERLLDETLLSVGRRSALERMAFVTLTLYDRCSQLGLTEDHKVTFPFTQQHLADAMGLSLVHTNKTIKLMAKRNLIRWKNGVFDVLNEKELRRIAQIEGKTRDVRPLI
jgi:CRP-like cAMP-binding protein